MLYWLHFAKHVSVGCLFAGTLGTFLARDLSDRRRFAYLLAGPGFGGAWVCGFLLASALSVSFFEPWVLGAITTSMFSLQVVLFTAGKEGRATKRTAALAVVPLVATVALMVWRPG